MSVETHPTKDTPKNVHGATGPYIIGYILSLIFTFIPYYLVVNKTIAGNLLVVVILSIGVLQMIVQLVFFLHLGRGPKPLYNVVFFVATAGTILVTIGAALFIMNNLYRNMSPQEMALRQSQEENISQIGGEATGACAAVKNSHIITISGSRPEPVNIEAELCDTLTFVNKDEEDREIQFGLPGQPESYGGHYEVLVRGKRPETITLNQTGDFIFHDKLDFDLAGYFSVSAP